MKAIIVLSFLVSMSAYGAGGAATEKKEYGFTFKKGCGADAIKESVEQVFKAKGLTNAPDPDLLNKINKTCTDMESTVETTCSPDDKMYVLEKTIKYAFKESITKPAVKNSYSKEIGTSESPKTVTFKFYHTGCGPSSSDLYYKGKKQAKGVSIYFDFGK